MHADSSAGHRKTALILEFSDEADRETRRIIGDGADNRMSIEIGNGWIQERYLHLWMGEALAEAQKALVKGEIPIGAVVVCENTIIGRGHNLKETARDPTAHAEVIALREAGSATGTWRLHNATLYVTTEPCFMCWGAIYEARIARVVYGGFPSPEDTSHLNREVLERIRSRITVIAGIRAGEASALIRQFFRARRDRRRDLATWAGEVAEHG